MSKFPAKILLAGEYGVLHGGAAVALPLARWSGHWSKSVVDADLAALRARWSPSVSKLLDLRRFDADLARGLSFASTIPVGAGLGSSGALCAAIWASYRSLVVSWKDVPISTLQEELRLLEAPLHGTSSGLDPLISLTQQCFVHQAGQWQSEATLPVKLAKIISQRPIFLLDSGRSRQTAPLVTKFNQWLQTTSRQQQFANYLELNEDLINQALIGEMDSVFQAWQRLCLWQRHHMQYLIPADIANIWDQGIRSQTYFLKLCGAGGGGFFLGMASSDQQLVQLGQNVPFSIEVLDLTSFALK